MKRLLIVGLASVSIFAFAVVMWTPQAEVDVQANTDVFVPHEAIDITSTHAKEEIVLIAKEEGAEVLLTAHETQQIKFDDAIAFTDTEVTATTGPGKRFATGPPILQSGNLADNYRAMSEGRPILLC